MWTAHHLSQAPPPAPQEVLWLRWGHTCVGQPVPDSDPITSLGVCLLPTQSLSSFKQMKHLRCGALVLGVQRPVPCFWYPRHSPCPACALQRGGEESSSEGQVEQSESPPRSQEPPPPPSSGRTGQVPTGSAATHGGGSDGPSVTDCRPPDTRAQNRWQVSVPVGGKGAAVFLKVTSVALTSRNEAIRIMGSAGAQSP